MTVPVAVTLLLFAWFALAGVVDVYAAATLEVESSSEAPEFPWLLVMAVIAAPFIVGLTLGAIIRKRHGLSFF